MDQSLAAGTYTLDVWFGAVNHTGGTTVYDNGSGGISSSPTDFSATFSVVPEPITVALPLFGGLMLTAGLARRFLARRVDPVV